MCGAMWCLLASSCCHLLSCHSERLRLDYIGISGLIVTSFYPLVYYFLCHHFYRYLYNAFITAFGTGTIVISFIPAFQTPKFRPVRSMLFFSMGISGLVPTLHKAIMFRGKMEAMVTTAYEFLMGCFYAMGVAVYNARVPERWMPGRFDLTGHSHQLFHVLVVAGAYTHYLACLVYLKWRDMPVC